MRRWMERPRPEPLVTPGALQAAAVEGAAAAAHFALPLSRRAWRGPAGVWDGSARGTSLEFQDHRPYQPGDDPRHINWQAYARTDALTMKVYREEVMPRVDLVLDVSASMRLHGAKWRRALEAFCFARAAAERSGAALRAHLVDAEARPLDGIELDGLDTAPVEREVPALEGVRFRPGSLRLVVSDVLFPAPPESWLRRLVEGAGRGLLLAPWAAAEAEPDWRGELELVDCESGRRRERAFDESARRLYAAAYARHVETWRSSARRYGVLFARLPEAGRLVDALAGEPLRSGAVAVAA